MTTICPVRRARHEHLLYVGLEDPSGGRPFYGQRRSHPLRRSCSRATSCSCPGCAAPKDAVARLWARNRRSAESEVCIPHSSTKTSLSGSTAAATITRQAALSNSLRSVASAPLFPGRSDPGYGAAHGGATHREPRDGLHVVAALLEGGEGALLGGPPPRASWPIVQLRSRSGSLLRGQRFSPGRPSRRSA